MCVTIQIRTFCCRRANARDHLLLRPDPPGSCARAALIPGSTRGRAKNQPGLVPGGQRRGRGRGARRRHEHCRGPDQPHLHPHGHGNGSIPIRHAASRRRQVLAARCLGNSGPHLFEGSGKPISPIAVTSDACAAAIRHVVTCHPHDPRCPADRVALHGPARAWIANATD